MLDIIFLRFKPLLSQGNNNFTVKKIFLSLSALQEACCEH